MGDPDILAAQLRESDALQEDIATLQPNHENINSSGQELVERCGTEFGRQLREQLERLNMEWAALLQAAHRQNTQLGAAHTKSTEVAGLVTSINAFLDQVS